MAIITRDRATTYTKAIHSTNPDIIQIADKWHFLKNLLDVVKGTISVRFPQGWFVRDEESMTVVPIPDVIEEEQMSPALLSKKEQSQWELILTVQETYKQLGSLRKTAQHLQLNRTTVAKYINLTEVPKQKRKPRLNQFLPYLKLMTQWCKEGKTAAWIHDELKQQGFKGAPSSTRRKVQEIKDTLPKKCRVVPVKISKKPSKSLKATKFQLISLIWRKPTSLTQAELDLLKELFQANADLRIYIQLFKSLEI